MARPSAEQLRYILESGILAPSADNRHPLRFETDETGVNVWHSAGLPRAGYKRVLALLSLGAVAENIAVAANRFQLRGEPVLFPALESQDLVARLNWTPGEPLDDASSLWEAVPRRQTNRNIRYRGPGLSLLERKRLSERVEAQFGVGTGWLDEPDRRHKALRLLRLAEGERFRSKVLHDELFGAIRFDVGWKRTCDEGLPPGALGIERPLRAAFAALRHWPVMRVANLLGSHRMLAWRAADLPCRFAPHLAVICVRQTDDQSVFLAGRAMQRIWLEITRAGLVSQPFAASALYALEGSREDGIPSRLQQRLRRGWAELLPGWHPLIVLRAGRAEPPSAKAGRKPLEAYWRVNR